MIELINIVAPLFGLIYMGFLSVKLKILPRDVYPFLSSFVIKISFPCLLLTKLSAIDPSQHFRLDILLIFGVCSVVLALVSIGFFRHILGYGNTPSILQGGMGTALSNNGFVGYPILFLTFSNPPMTTYAIVLLVENIIMLPLIIFLLERCQAQRTSNAGNRVVAEVALSLFKNPIVIAVAAALVLSLTSISIPEPIFLPISMLGNAAAPLALFVIGMAFVEASGFGSFKDIAWTSFGKLVLHPALIAFCCVLFVDNFDDPDVYAVILLASSPMASLYPVFGAKYGIPDLTASCLAITTIFSLFTISAWLLLLGV